MTLDMYNGATSIGNHKVKRGLRGQFRILVVLVLIVCAGLLILLINFRDIPGRVSRFLPIWNGEQFDSQNSSAEQPPINYRKCVENGTDPACLYQWNSKKKLPPYADPAALGKCSVSDSYRQFVFDVLQKWMKISAEFNITWWLDAGSLIGALRHKDVIPYDHDADLSIPQTDEGKVRALVKSRYNVSPLRIYVRRDKYDGTRVNCGGTVVHSMTDRCAFNGPLSRIISTYRFFDIFLYQTINKTHGHPEVDDNTKRVYRHDVIYPLKLCSFMNLSVPCPQKSREYLLPRYSKDISKPIKKCEGGSWRSM